MRYHGDGLYQWDTWCHVAPGGLVHAFYLQQARPDGVRAPREADSLGHAVSRNLIDWEEQPPVVAPEPTGQLGDLVNWTGSTVRDGDLFYLFYTIRSSATRAAFRRSVSRPASTCGPGRSTRRTRCWSPTAAGTNRAGARSERRRRLPGPDGRQAPTRCGWFGVFATRVVTDELPRGALFGGDYSEDLMHWEQNGRVFRSAQNAYSIVEMPDPFELEGRWYLTFLEDNAYGNRDVLGEPEISSGIRYAIADRIEAPTSNRPTTSCWPRVASTGSAAAPSGSVTGCTSSTPRTNARSRTRPGRLSGCSPCPRSCDWSTDDRGSASPRSCAGRPTATLISPAQRPRSTEHRGMHESRGRWTQDESGRWVTVAPWRCSMRSVSRSLSARCLGSRSSTLARGRSSVAATTGYAWSANGEFTEVFLDDEPVLQPASSTAIVRRHPHQPHLERRLRRTPPHRRQGTNWRA